MDKGTVRGILVDPFARTVTEVQHDTSDYRNIYTALSAPEHKVDCFTVLNVGDDPDGQDGSMFLDDNGLLVGRTSFFLWTGYPQPLAGKGLILGCDDEGETIGTSLTLDYVQQHVAWCGEQHGDRVLEAFPPKVVPMTSEQFDRYLENGELPQS
jgi:hypothetical protein